MPPPATAPHDDVYYAEDIDDLLADEEPSTPLTVAPVEDVPTQPEFKSIEISPDDDLLIDDTLTDEVSAAPPADDDPFWSPEITGELPPLNGSSEPLARSETPEPSFEPPALDLRHEPEPPPSKNDYLAAARKAAQAQSQVKTRDNDTGAAPRLSLRGSSRIILWGAASLIAVLLIGGAKWFSDRQEAATAAQPQGEPERAPAEIYDPNAPFGAPAPDPFAEAPVEGLAEPDSAPAEGPPVAQNSGTRPTGAVVAGPLAPRNVTLEQAAQAGDLTAQYELALQRLGSGRTQEGVTLLRRAADRGFPMAQYRLAKLYERGEGVQADLAVARQWTERAAGAGNRRAMHDLGVYFARGEGAPLDEAAAFRWFRQAAELGVADSQYNLGVLYQQGRGVNASASEALFWFLVAARQGDQDAGARATALEGQLQPIQIEQARARAQAFRPRAASAVANGEFGARAWARPGA
jgi:localization factor PodJL